MRRLLFVFSDVRRGAGCLSSGMLGEGWSFVFSDVRGGGGFFSTVMLGEGVVVCLQ